MAIAAPTQALPSSSKMTGSMYCSWISRCSTCVNMFTCLLLIVYLAKVNKAFVVKIHSDYMETLFFLQINLIISFYPRSCFANNHKMINPTWFLRRQAPEPTIRLMPRCLSMSGGIMAARFWMMPRHTDLVTLLKLRLPCIYVMALKLKGIGQCIRWFWAPYDVSYSLSGQLIHVQRSFPLPFLTPLAESYSEVNTRPARKTKEYDWEPDVGRKKEI